MSTIWRDTGLQTQDTLPSITRKALKGQVGGGKNVYCDRTAVFLNPDGRTQRRCSGRLRHVCRQKSDQRATTAAAAVVSIRTPSNGINTLTGALSSTELD